MVLAEDFQRLVDDVAAGPQPSFEESNLAQKRLHELVPGGAHTYARGSDQYPEEMAPVIARGLGARVQDVDGNWFVEYGMGLRAITLGHGYRPVLDSVTQAIQDGVSFSRPSVWELRAAETFLAQVPTADMVKFAKNGSDATTAAVKVSRAVTGRDLVAVCSSQPFFSTDDWFIATTHMPGGVAAAARSATVGFDYNRLDSLQDLIARYDDQIACVIMEAGTALAEPEPGFLEGVRELTRRNGIVLIFDEIITGMRWAAAGAQSVYGVTPDLSTWGKALGNGFSISALAGRRDLMEIGGLNTDRARAFLLSTTNGPEVTGLAAYLAVADAYRERDIISIMETKGEQLARGVNEASRSYGLQAHVAAIGRPSCMIFTTKDQNGNPSQEFRTLFLQELLKRGVLGQSFVISAAHTDADIDQTIEAVEGALPVYAAALERGTTDGLLKGRPVAPALREHAHPRRLDPAS
jgi:glutamate-1-semialdehyde 2,1-aminomutase